MYQISYSDSMTGAKWVCFGSFNIHCREVWIAHMTEKPNIIRCNVNFWGKLRIASKLTQSQKTEKSLSHSGPDHD